MWPDYGYTEAGLPIPHPDGAPPPRTDSGATASPCSAQGGGERAVIVAAGNYNDVSKGTAALLTINRNGHLADTSVRLGPIAMPKAIAMRPDSREAAISYGNSSANGTTPHGVVVISVSPDGSQAAIVETKVLEGNFGPLYLGYTSNDSLIVSRVGPTKDNLLPLTRPPGGRLVAGTPYEVPGEFPQDVVALPRVDHEALYLQAMITGGSTSSVYRISDTGGTIAVQGAPAVFDDMPMAFYVHPTLNVAYVPTALPSSGTPPTNPPGALKVMTPGAGGDWAVAQPPFNMPQLASLAAVAPSGEFIAFTDADSGTGNYELYTVKLDGAGLPTAASAPLPYPASMAFDVAVTPEGHIVVSRNGGSSGPYDVIVFARTGPETWQQCPESVVFDGAAELEIAR